MPRTSKSGSLKIIAAQRADDYKWGIPESPEFSAVQRLMHEFQTHESDEARWVAIYNKLAHESEDPLIRFLLSLIVADEERHHEIIHHIVSGLKDELAWTRSETVAAKLPGQGQRARELSKTVERLLAVERDGIGEYEKLVKTTEGFHQDLFGMLCRTMIHDSLKHISILDFLKLKLRERQRPAKRRRAKTKS
jgi:rubrerythrin